MQSRITGKLTGTAPSWDVSTPPVGLFHIANWRVYGSELGFPPFLPFFFLPPFFFFCSALGIQHSGHLLRFTNLSQDFQKSTVFFLGDSRQRKRIQHFFRTQLSIPILVGFANEVDEITSVDGGQTLCECLL